MNILGKIIAGIFILNTVGNILVFCTIASETNRLKEEHPEVFGNNN